MFYLGTHCLYLFVSVFSLLFPSLASKFQVFFFHLFIYSYIVWAISSPYPLPLPSLPHPQSLGLILRSLIHFELILVSGERYRSNFSFLHTYIQFSQQYLLKRLSLLHCQKVCKGRRYKNVY
jgi:hypothetical protein